MTATNQLIHKIINNFRTERWFICGSVVASCPSNSFLVKFASKLPLSITTYVASDSLSVSRADVCVCVCVCSIVSNSFATPWTVAYQASLSMRFPRQEQWNELPFPSPGDIPGPRIEPGSPHCRWILCCWATGGSWNSRAVGQRIWASFVGDNFRKHQQCQYTRILTLPMANDSVLILSSSVSNVPGTVRNISHEFAHLSVILLNVHQLCEVGTNNLSLLQIEQICKCIANNNWWVQEGWFFWLSSWKCYYLLSIFLS